MPARREHGSHPNIAVAELIGLSAKNLQEIQMMTVEKTNSPPPPGSKTGNRLVGL